MTPPVFQLYKRGYDRHFSPKISVRLFTTGRWGSVIDETWVSFLDPGPDARERMRTDEETEFPPVRTYKVPKPGRRQVLWGEVQVKDVKDF